MDVGEIIKSYLIENKFDGLYNPDIECGCSLDELFICDNCFNGCIPGIKKEDPDGEYIYLIGPRNESDIVS